MANPETGIQRREMLAALGLTVSAPAWARLDRIGRATHPAAVDGLRLLYSTPASEIALLSEGLPIGNGSLGALCGGDPARTCLYLSEGSLWLGGRNDASGVDGQFPYDRDGFGSMMMLARVHLVLDGHAFADLTDYRRVLDLDRGCVEITYRRNGIAFRQTMFASHPGRVIVITVECGAGGACTGRVELAGVRGEAVRATATGLDVAANLASGLRYAAAIRVAQVGGDLHAEAAAVRFDRCQAITIAIGGGTDYAPSFADDFRDPAKDPLRNASAAADEALASGAGAVLSRHLRDYRAAFGSFSVNLGTSTPEQRAMPVSDRLAARARADGRPDPELDALYLQFGRYLTIASSRTTLPSALQGLWLVDDRPPWMGDYHTDINIQMNYWLPDRAGLSDSFRPLTDFCVAQLPSWTRITERHFNDSRNRFRNRSGKVAGWAVAISLNVHGGMGWWWHPAGNAWLCNSLWQHYEFTHDRAHLETIYPLLAGAVAFWEARLIEITVPDAAGGSRQVLIDDYDWSPEQGPDQARGITYAQMLVEDLFRNYCAAAALLDRDADRREKVNALAARLYRPAISPTRGALEEWMTPDDLGEPHHRHLSPLIGLFPGDAIRADDSPPALVTAARALLAARGMHSTGWADAWRAACCARLKDGEQAYLALGGGLAPIGDYSGTSPNFLNTDHDPDVPDGAPPRTIFQIDGNFGLPTAMLEMLLYSREGRIEILPALPSAWAAEGSVMGVGARGGFRVDMRWRDRRATEVVLHSIGGTATTVAVNGALHPVSMAAGGTVRII